MARKLLHNEPTGRVGDAAGESAGLWRYVFTRVF